LFFFVLSLLLLTQSSTFDDNNLILHFYFLKKNIPIISIIEISYLTFGVFLFTVFYGTLDKKGTIVVGLFCTKKQSLKKMEVFFKLLKNKNEYCVINI